MVHNNRVLLNVVHEHCSTKTEYTHNTRRSAEPHTSIVSWPTLLIEEFRRGDESLTFLRGSKFTDDLHPRNRMPPKAFCWSHLGCIRTKFLKSWFHVIDDYRLKYFSSAGLPWSPASNSLTHHECSQLTSTSRIKVSLWLESASFMENLDESSASLKKRCKKYLGQVATISCNVSQRVSRKGCMKGNSL